MALGVEKNVKYTLIGGPRESAVGRSNLITNPKGKDGFVGWLTGGLSTFEAVALDGTTHPAPPTGLDAYTGMHAVTTDAAGSDRAYQAFAVTAGEVWTVSVWVRPVVGASGIRLYLFDGDGSGVIGLADTTALGQWVRLSVTGTMLTTGNAILQTRELGASGTYEWYFTAAQAIQTDVLGPYFDGDTPGYAWTGTPHRSTSVQDGTRAVLNDSTDPDYVGALNEITGLDSPEVIESVDDNIEEDGATHGRFFSGRRPVTFQGLCYGHNTAIARNTKLQRLTSALNALRSDGTLIWQPSGAEEVSIKVRKQQPTRIEGGWNKTFQGLIVAADPRIEGTMLRRDEIAAAGSGTAGRSYDRSYNVNYDWAPSRGTATINNAGDGNAAPIVTIKGDCDTIAIQNNTTEEELALNINLATTDVLEIDFKHKTVILNGTTTQYSTVDSTRSFWWNLIPGDNTVNFLAANYSGAVTATIEWRNTWL